MYCKKSLWCFKQHFLLKLNYKSFLLFYYSSFPCKCMLYCTTLLFSNYSLPFYIKTFCIWVLACMGYNEINKWYIGNGHVLSLSTQMSNRPYSYFNNAILDRLPCLYFWVALSWKSKDWHHCITFYCFVKCCIFLAFRHFDCV